MATAGKQHPQISWHRAGAGDLKPAEMDDFVKAVAAGAELIEFDLRKLRDEEIAVFHDAATQDGTPLSSLSLSELRRKTQLEIPTFRQVLSAISGKCTAHIDLKEEGYEAEVVSLASKMIHDDFVITSLEDNSIRSIKEKWPAVKVGLSLGRDLTGSNIYHHLLTRLSELFPERRTTAASPDFLTVNHKLAKLTLLRFSARTGVPLWIWTVDDAPTQEYFLQREQVEVLITNKPRQAAALRARLGQKQSAKDT